jgi:hypothetical protein
MIPMEISHFEIYDLTTHTWYTQAYEVKSIERAAILSVNNVIYVAGGFAPGPSIYMVINLK